MLSSKTITEVKNIAKIKDIVEDYVNLKKSGIRYVGCCPFHSERTPSFFISESGNFYKCFGCGEAGDPISFIEQIEKVNFIEAIEIIAKKYNISVEYENANKDSEEETKYKEKKSSEIILTAAENFFKENIKENKNVIKYLRERGINEKIINEFNLGFSNGNIYNYFKKNNYNIDLAIKLGIIKNDKSETFLNRIIIPIHDQSGKTIGFGARTQNENKNEPKYINSQENMLFYKSENLYNIDKAKAHICKENNAYIVEGYFDAISLYSIDIKNVVATCGTALTDKQCFLLKKYTSNITLFFDNDTAGKKATIRAIEKLIKNNIFINIVNLENYKDPDEIIRNNDIEKSKEIVKNSTVDLIDFLIEHFGYEKENNLNKKNEILHFINNIIKEIKDEIYKKLLLNKLKSISKIEITKDLKTKKEQHFNKLEWVNIIEEYENRIISILLKNIETKQIDTVMIEKIIQELDTYTFKNVKNEEVFKLYKKASNQQKNTIQSIISLTDDNDIKKKIINSITSENDKIIPALISTIGKTQSEIISKSQNDANLTILKMKLYYIRNEIKEKKKLIKNYEDKNALINEIKDLKSIEKKIANVLKLVIF